MGAYFIIIFGLLLFFLKLHHRHKGKMDVLQFITSFFLHNWVYVNEWLWKALKDKGWLQGEPSEEKAGTYSPTFSGSRRGWSLNQSMTNDQWFNQSYLSNNEASIKTQKKRIQRALEIWESGTLKESVEALCYAVKYLSLCISYSAVPELYPFVIKR